MGGRLKATVKAFSRGLFAAPLLKGLDKDFVCTNVMSMPGGETLTLRRKIEEQKRKMIHEAEKSESVPAMGKEQMSNFPFPITFL